MNIQVDLLVIPLQSPSIHSCRCTVRELMNRRTDRVYGPNGYSLPADMWSVGIICFALMGGRFPYKEVEPRALAEEARTTKLYFPENPWGTVSESAKHFIQGLLRVNPKKRLTAAQALDHPVRSLPSCIATRALPSWVLIGLIWR